MKIEETGRGLAVDLAIQRPNGIHARPAAKIAQTARNFTSRIILISEFGEVDCKSMLDILSLALAANDPVRILAQGPDAREALLHLYPLFGPEGN